jgi:hypothetical protein
VALWLGIGRHYTGSIIDDLTEEVVRNMTHSQIGFFRSVKAIANHIGDGFFVELSDRGVFLQNVPAKNLVEQLNAVLRRRALIASLNVNYDPKDHKRILDDFAVDFNQWFAGNLTSRELANYNAGRRRLTTPALNQFLVYIRTPRPVKKNSPTNNPTV